MPHRVKIQSRTVRIGQISESDLGIMYALFSQYYVDIDLDRFRSDLREKTHCMLFHTVCTNPSTDKFSELIGFSTLMERFDEKRNATFLFSGDTVIDRRFWGRQLLQREFFWYILRHKLRAPWRPVYWMLISKGYVTYMTMVRHFPRSHPRWDLEFPADLRAARDEYYSERYGDAYDADSGLIRFAKSHGAVRGHLADPQGATTKNPHVQYFLARNPGYAEGHELACIAEIRLRDFPRQVLDVFLARRRRSRRSGPKTRGLQGQGS